MLTIYRRHTTACKHRCKGRSYRRCPCPIHVQGTLAGKPIRESLRLQNWEKAQQRVRDMEATGQREELTEPDEEPVTVRFACERFLEDAQTRGLAESTMKKYRQLTKGLIAFAAQHRKNDLRDWNIGVVRLFRASWKDGPRSALKKLERFKAFFRFALDSEWIPEDPARKLKNPIVRPNQTLPFEGEQILARSSPRLRAGND